MKPTSPTIGLVLSGGGVRGVAHLGLLQVLEEIGIEPVAFSGTSAGALVGALLTELFYPRPGVPEPLDLPGPVHVSEIEGAAAAADPPS